MLTADLNSKLIQLKEYLKKQHYLIVAFSGGVDSTFLLKVASLALGDNLLAVTATSPTYPKRELKAAKEFCLEHNIKQRIIISDETAIEEFKKNDKDRCYYCKRELFTILTQIAKEIPEGVVAEGTNSDDTTDYRPGMRAIKELKIISPLKDCNLNKNEIRTISKELNLSTWNKQAMACLISRFPYNIPIENSQLSILEKAEDFLVNEGFSTFRVRHHGDIARIEFGPDDIERAFEMRTQISDYIKKLGYLYVTIDLDGYRTGSMNDML